MFWGDSSTLQEAVKLLAAAAFWIVTVQILTAVLKRSRMVAKAVRTIKYYLSGARLAPEDVPSGDILVIKLGCYSKTSELNIQDVHHRMKRFKQVYCRVRNFCLPASGLILHSYCMLIIIAKHTS